MKFFEDRAGRAAEKQADFLARVGATVETAAAEVVADKRATLTQEWVNGPGDVLLLTPANPKACPVMVLLDDYPTVVYDGATDEMFGRVDDRLECLAADIADVIAGRFYWGYRKQKMPWSWVGSSTVMYGEFPGRTPTRRFTRVGDNPDGVVERHDFEPY